MLTAGQNSPFATTTKMKPGEGWGRKGLETKQSENNNFNCIPIIIIIEAFSALKCSFSCNNKIWTIIDPWIRLQIR